MKKFCYALFALAFLVGIPQMYVHKDSKASAKYAQPKSIFSSSPEIDNLSG